MSLYKVLERLNILRRGIYDVFVWIIEDFLEELLSSIGEIGL